jgi:predicted DNA-binding protein with PD1-like motif
MKFKRIQNNYLVRLEKGEKVIESLTNFLVENNIASGVLRGLGAINRAELTYYSLKDKQYHSKTYDGEFEVISISANIAQVDEAPFIHMHITLSDTSFNVFGGHLIEATVGPTLEIFIEPFKGCINRKYNEDIGLKLLDL